MHITKAWQARDVKVDKDNDFDILKLSTRMKAPSAEFSNGVMLGGDPTEIGVAVNEFVTT